MREVEGSARALISGEIVPEPDRFGAGAPAPPEKAGAGRWARRVAIALTLAPLCLLAPAPRAGLAALWPASAKVFAALGLGPAPEALAFADVVSELREENGARVLQIEGKVVSVAPTHQRLPAIRVTLRDKTGRDLYAWIAAPGAPGLAAGDSMPFRTRLAAPPDSAAEVLLRFTPRADARPGERGS